MFRTIARLLLAAFLLPAGPSLLAADTARDSLLVSTAWLAQHLKDPDLILLHVGDKAEYDAAHLPGARFVSLQDISVSDRTGTRNGLTLEMLPPDTLRDRLAGLGISDASRVIVYFGKDWVSPSTRLIFTLDYAGLGARSSLLDGGQPAWVRDGHAVTAIVPEAKAGTLSPLKIRPLVVDANYVRSHLDGKGVVVIDARDKAFYGGTQPGGSREAPKFGHIPGAASLPFNETTTEALLAKSPAELQALFTKAGVKTGDTVVAYCHIGQQATAVLFAARTLGYKTLLYDGSIQDWTRHADAVLVNPAAPAPAPTPK